MRSNIPLELRERAQWVCADAEKKPFNPLTGKLADVTDPSTWVTFEEADSADYPHIGYVLSADDPYSFIDLDKPVSPEQEERHQKIIDAFPSYTEVSQSGDGLHIVVKGEIPSGARRDKVEVYSSERHMICTGKVFRDLPIKDCQETLNTLYKEIKKQEVVIGSYTDQPEKHTDATLVEIAMNAVNGDKFNRLCCGDIEGYESHSEADFALLSMLAYYSDSNEQVRRIFRLSPLGKREKHQKTDYRINLALEKIRARQPANVDMAESKKLSEWLRAGSEEQVHKAGNLSLPPGLVGEIAQYIYSTSIRPVPEVALVAALGLVAGISGRAFFTSGLPTGLNLYLILLGETGVGKEGGKQGINLLLSEVRKSVPMIDRFVGPTSFASGQALVKYFDGRPCFYSILDEFGHTLRRITGPKATNAEQAMHSELLALYSRSGPNGLVGVQAYSDKEKNTATVHAPSLTIMGESTPGVFFDSLDGALVQDGLVPRLLVVEYTGKRPPRNRGAGFKPDEGLTRRLADLATVAVASEQNNKFVKAEISPDAMTLLDDFDQLCDYEINEGSGVEKQLWNRAHLNALKVASVLAVGSNPFFPEVQPEHAIWAIDFVRRSVDSVQSRFDQGEVGGGDAAKAEAAFRKAVTDYLSMNPEKRAVYKTPKSLLSSHVIPQGYLREKLKRVQPFKNEMRILDETIRQMIDAGALNQVPPNQVRTEFNLNTKAYVLGKCW